MKNAYLSTYVFLKHMRRDFPMPLVLKGVNVLRDLCTQIENQQPRDLAALYVLTHAATEKFNDLADEFYRAGRTVDTIAREIICDDFWVIANTYGFTDADPEELVAPRHW